MEVGELRELVGCTAAAAAAAGGSDLLAELTELADLKAAGVLTDDEFTAARAKLLA